MKLMNLQLDMDFYESAKALIITINDATIWLST